MVNHVKVGPAVNCHPNKPVVLFHYFGRSPRSRDRYSAQTFYGFGVEKLVCRACRGDGPARKLIVLIDDKLNVAVIWFRGPVSIEYRSDRDADPVKNIDARGTCAALSWYDEGKPD